MDTIKPGSAGDWLGFVLLLVPGAVLSGWALSLLWLWFVVPLFAVRPITVGEAIGLSITFGLVRSASYDKDRALIAQLLVAMFGVLVALGIAALLHYGFGVGLAR